MALENIEEAGRRDKIEIMTNLLDIMSEPHRLTHILYKSNMSYVQLVKYLNNLMEMGFAERIDKPYRFFKITENGKIFKDLVNRNGNNGHPNP